MKQKDQNLPSSCALDLYDFEVMNVVFVLSAQCAGEGLNYFDTRAHQFSNNQTFS